MGLLTGHRRQRAKNGEFSRGSIECAWKVGTSSPPAVTYAAERQRLTVKYRTTSLAQCAPFVGHRISGVSQDRFADGRLKSRRTLDKPECARTGVRFAGGRPAREAAGMMSLFTCVG